MADLTLRNGTVVTPTGLIRGGLSASGGVITHVGVDAELPQGDTDIDIGGKVLLPGLIDPNLPPDQQPLHDSSNPNSVGHVAQPLHPDRFSPQSQPPATTQQTAPQPRSDH